MFVFDVEDAADADETSSECVDDVDAAVNKIRSSTITIDSRAEGHPRSRNVART